MLVYDSMQFLSVSIVRIGIEPPLSSLNPVDWRWFWAHKPFDGLELNTCFLHSWAPFPLRTLFINVSDDHWSDLLLLNMKLFSEDESKQDEEKWNEQRSLTAKLRPIMFRPLSWKNALTRSHDLRFSWLSSPSNLGTKSLVWALLPGSFLGRRELPWRSTSYPASSR